MSFLRLGAGRLLEPLVSLKNYIFARKMNQDLYEAVAYAHEKVTELVAEENDPKERDRIIQQFIQGLKLPLQQDFKNGLEWFNVSEPLSFAKHLKGKVVVLDFFTYCCINCMHVFPDLKDLEKEFSIEDGLVVIGVHSAKFDNEKDSANILAAVQRYNVSHPVVNDRETLMWNACGISCWPTLLILGPNANPLFMLMGEGHKDNLILYVRNALSLYKSRNEISNHKLPFKSAYHLLPELKGPLLFPGKIASFYDGRNELLAISDSGNHRILVTDSNGTILHRIGGNRMGNKDGSLSESEFNSPQGLVFFDSHTLYVADTENHLIRKIDLKGKRVTTVAGTGVQGIDRIGGKVGTKQEISSPWDVCIYRTPDMDLTFHPPDESVEAKDVLLIAMAGVHQIWALFLDDTVWWKFKRFPAGTCVCVVGSGREENRNNMYPQSAGFAQPSGLALCVERRELYVADSESSSIRRVSLIDGKVSAVVGGDKSPNNLFSFGDIDGQLDQGKLQHPLGVALTKDDNVLYVADTYNHKIKKVDIITNTVSSLCGSASSGNNCDPLKGDFSFNEPAGLCPSWDSSKIYLADTNNHSIKVLHLLPDQTVAKVTKFPLKSNEGSFKPDERKYKIITGRNFTFSTTGGKLSLNLVFDIGDDYVLSNSSPQRWTARFPSETWSSVPAGGDFSNPLELIVSVPQEQESETTLKLYVEFNLINCKGDACVPLYFVVQNTVAFVANGPTKVESNVKIEMKRSGFTVI